MTNLVESTPFASMPAAGGPTVVIASDHDKAMYYDDGTDYARADGHLASWVSMSGTNLISDKGGLVAIGTAGARQVSLGFLPANVAVVNVRIESAVAFNSGTSDTISVGIAATPTLFSNAINVHDTAGVETVTAAGQAYRSARTPVIAELTFVGAAPTAGKVLIMVTFVRVPTIP